MATLFGALAKKTVCPLGHKEWKSTQMTFYLYLLIYPFFTCLFWCIWASTPGNCLDMAIQMNANPIFVNYILCEATFLIVWEYLVNHISLYCEKSYWFWQQNWVSKKKDLPKKIKSLFGEQVCYLSWSHFTTFVN